MVVPSGTVSKKPVGKKVLKIKAEVLRASQNSYRRASAPETSQGWRSCPRERATPGWEPSCEGLAATLSLFITVQMEGLSCISSRSLAASVCCSPEHLLGWRGPRGFAPGGPASPKGQGLGPSNRDSANEVEGLSSVSW